jgi:tetratricopeptide (TPR) repeat protein
MRWWIGGGVVLAVGALIAATAVVLLNPDAGVPQWRKDLRATQRGADKDWDRPKVIASLQALLKEAQAGNQPAAQFEVLQELAKRYRQWGPIADAIAAYRALVALPRFEPMPAELKDAEPQFKYWIASLLCQKGAHDEGIAAFREVIAAKGAEQATYFGLAECLKAAGRVEEGVAVLRENLTRMKAAGRNGAREMLLAHAQLALALADAKRLSEARVEFLSLLHIFSWRAYMRPSSAEDAFRQAYEQVIKAHEDGGKLLRDRGQEETQQREMMERNLFDLIDRLTLLGVFSPLPSPN